MRKLISAVLIAITLLYFVACNDEENEVSKDATSEISVESIISEETTEEIDISIEVSEPEADKNTMFTTESPTSATIINEHKDDIIITYNNGKYYVDSRYSKNVYTSLVMKEGAADEIGAFAFNPEYKEIVESSKELAFYGLDSDENASAVIKVEGYALRRCIRIGNKTEGGYFAACDDGSGNYDGTVYVVGEVAGLATKPIEYFVEGVYEAKNLNVSDIFYYTDNIWIETPEEKFALSYLTPEERAKHSVEDAWKLTAPEVYFPVGEEYALCNSYYMGGMLYKLLTLRSENVLVALPEDEDMAKYGLDKPYRSYTVFIRASGVYIYMTQPDEKGNMYIGGKRVDGGGDVYYTTYFPISVINVEDFPYVNHDVYSFVDDRLIAYSLDDVTTMTVEKDGKSHLIDFEVDSNGYRYSRFNGVPGKYDNTDKFYYAGIYNARINSIYTGTLPTEFDISVTVNCGGKDTRLDFKYNEDETAVCVVDGKKAYNIGTAISGYYNLCVMLDIMIKGEFIPD